MVITNTAAAIPTRNVRALISRPPFFAFSRFRRFWSKKVYIRQRLVVPRFGMGDKGIAAGISLADRSGRVRGQ